jgi:hypothetical protein
MTKRIPGAVLWIFLMMTPCLFAKNATPGGVPPGGEMAESSPGQPGQMDASIQSAQQEVQNPFARRFAPPEVKVQEPEKAAPVVVAVLQGIGLGGKDGYAVIGDSVYHEGEEKNGIKLLEVKRGEVDIIANGVVRTLPLFPDGELKKARERLEKKTGQTVPSGDAPHTKGQESFPKGGQGLS